MQGQICPKYEVHILVGLTSKPLTAVDIGQGARWAIDSIVGGGDEKG